MPGAFPTRLPARLLASLALLCAGLGLSPLRAETLTVSNGKRALEVTALSDTVVRVRMAAQKGDKIQFPEDASWAVETARRAERSAKAVTTATSLTTPALRLSVDPASLRITVTDPAGKVIVDDEAEPWIADGSRFTLRKRMTRSEHIFGLGDKTGALDRRGGSFVNWNTDSYGFRSSDDPIYKSVPFFISSGGEGGAYGLFLDNTFRSWFDFGHLTDGTIEIGAEDGPVDYYIIAGPSVAEVVRRYTALTGRAPLPPRWVLGYQQSRWSYMSEQEVRDLAARLRKERVPTDVIWLDIDFQDRNRPFTVDRKTFPHFEAMIGDLAAQGIHTVAITDLHVAALPGQNYAPYDTGIAGNHFLHNPDGSLYVGPVWPGPSVFPDFTRAETREWWGRLFADLDKAGVAGIWNDMNEPAIFDTPTKTMPLGTLHRIAGDGFTARTTSHAELHNVYGMENSRATYEGLRKLRPDSRAFVMTRASYAGGQRYAATWTGDNTASWDHLKLSVAQAMNLGMSGFAWSGSDVGGFTGGPGPDLLTRWFQFATFAPIFRDHSQKDAPRAEPWVDGEAHLAIRRRFVEERYRLMPYLYGLAEANARLGDPVMRPLFYDYPAMVDSQCDTAMQFTVGGRLMVAGAPKPESPAVYQACLPAGDWFDYWSGEPVKGRPEPGGRYATLDVTPRIDSLPVYVRAGTILPRQPLVQSTGQKPAGPLELHVYPGPDCHGEIYDDDGQSMAFSRGVYLRQTFACETGTGGVTSLSIGKREGTYPAWWPALSVTIHGPVPGVARLKGKALPMQELGNAVAFALPPLPEEVS